LTAAGSDKTNASPALAPSTSQGSPGGHLATQLVLRLSGLPATATNEAFKTLLEEHKVPNQGCHVEIDPVTKQCKTGHGSVVFTNRAECKNLSALSFCSPCWSKGT